MGGVRDIIPSLHHPIIRIRFVETSKWRDNNETYSINSSSSAYQVS